MTKGTLINEKRYKVGGTGGRAQVQIGKGDARAGMRHRQRERGFVRSTEERQAL